MMFALQYLLWMINQTNGKARVYKDTLFSNIFSYKVPLCGSIYLDDSLEGDIEHCI